LSKYDLSLVKNTPKSCKVYDGSIPFPLFVKANNLGCSEGIDEGSVVHNDNELNTQLEKLYKITKDVIIQEFIEGNEYTALVFRNKHGEVICLGPVHLQFINPKVTFFTNEVKRSDDFEFEYNYNIMDQESLKQICIDVYNDLKLNSYIRMDLRNSLVVDVNPYPEILGNIEYEEMSDALLTKFYSHDDFMIDILYDATRKRALSPASSLCLQN
jgi:D-alanine-D-alanine ligase-like ATP-grasp enzyme